MLFAIEKRNTTCRIGLVALILTLFALPALAQTATDPNQPPRDLNARITDVQGKNVQVSLDDDQSWKPAKVDLELPKNAAVRTGFASTCEISFDTHSIVQIEPLSSVRIADFFGTDTEHQVRANLQYGAVRCGVDQGRIKADTEVSTPVSTLSIRGTRAYMEYNPGDCRAASASMRTAPSMSPTARSITNSSKACTPTKNSAATSAAPSSTASYGIMAISSGAASPTVN